MLGAFAAAVFLVLSSEDDRLEQTDQAAVAKSQQAHVDKPLIVERKAGKILWRLRASRAEQELGGKMHLIEPELELFSENGTRIPMTGREAWFNPLSKAIRFKGDVVAHYGEWVLYGDDVSYEHSTDTVRIPGDFRIEGTLTRTRGRGLTAWRGEHHVRVDEAVWIEDKHPYKMQVMP
ncbi:MAG: LPS export ABC transporter periplasmic protein LptC [Mariprofundaceae bacterium]|nr:LPS export ABC transporter periplasmic protein LptC [Mariprofundaceae bacterium]